MSLESSYEPKNLPEVKIGKILPSISTEKLLSYQQCYLGISMENPVFQGDSLEALLRWACGTFSDCLMLIGDDLCRYTQQILQGLTAEQALQAAHKLGDEFLERNQVLLKELSEKNLKITRWDEHIHTECFSKARQELDDLFQTNSEFKEFVEKDALSFIQRQKKNRKTFHVSDSEVLHYCCLYLLEEMAVFNCLSQLGRQVELYPGPELQVLAEVANGKFSNVPAGLTRRINVELKIEKSSVSGS